MNDRTETIKARIRKLLNLAGDDAAAAGEIANAMAAAQRLMDAHHLGTDDVGDEPKPHQAASMDDMDDRTIKMKQKALARWEGWLAVVICEMAGTVQCYRRRIGEPTKGASIFGRNECREVAAMVFYGPAEDVIVAAGLFVDLRTTVATMSVGQYGSPYKGDGREYAEGFVAGIGSKTRAAATERTAETSGAIVKVHDDAKAVAKKWLQKTHGFKLRKGRSSGGATHYNRSARDTGHADGASSGASFNRSTKVNSGGRQRYLGG